MDTFEVATTDNFGPRTVMVCTVCAALVLEAFERDHQVWHDDLNGRLNALSEAVEA